MGLYLSVYMGPYVRCDIRDVKLEVDVFGCTNAECVEWSKRSSYPDRGQGFCSVCGTQRGKSVRVDLYRPSAYSVLDEKEDLTQFAYDADEDTICLGSNLREGPRNFHPETSGDQIDLTEVDREAEMEWFQTRFSQDILKLRGVYDNVEIRWGLHLWHS